MIKKSQLFRPRLGDGHLLEHGRLLEFLWYMCSMIKDGLQYVMILYVDSKDPDQNA